VRKSRQKAPAKGEAVLINNTHCKKLGVRYLISQHKDWFTNMFGITKSLRLSRWQTNENYPTNVLLDEFRSENLPPIISALAPNARSWDT